MVSIQQDPDNPDKLLVSMAVTLFLDKVAVSALSDEIEKAVREQAIRDLQDNKEVKLAVFKAAQRLLLQKLGVIDSGNEKPAV